MAVDLAFDLSLLHGRCVGVRIPPPGAELDALVASLAPEERAAAVAWPDPRRRTWAGGRAALREALTRVGSPCPPVLSDERGAPILPAGVSGSISHKDSLAVALVAPASAGAVGVDLERVTPPRVDIARRVLGPGEQAALEGLPEEERGRRVVVTFSLKEAIYKAIAPVVQRYVGFREVTVEIEGDGGAAVRHALAELPGWAIEGRWALRDGLVLTTARATSRAPRGGLDGLPPPPSPRGPMRRS